MFTNGIAFVCFYVAELILSMIAKFLVHLLGEGEWRGEMGERRGRQRQWGKNGEGMEGQEMGMNKKQPQNATDLTFGDAVGGYQLISHIS